MKKQPLEIDNLVVIGHVKYCYRERTCNLIRVPLNRAHNDCHRVEQQDKFPLQQQIMPVNKFSTLVSL